MKSKTFFGACLVTVILAWCVKSQDLVLTNEPTGYVQTNKSSEYRIVNGRIYDVNSSPEWKTIVIPQSAAIKNLDRPWPSAAAAAAKALKFDGTRQPQTIVFQIPGIYNSSRPVYALIFNYPYSPRDFVAGNYQEESANGKMGGYDPITRKALRASEIVPGMLVPKAMHLRLFQKSQSTTNWDAYGHANIIPAKPFFDYGLPVTNSPAQ